MVHPQNWGHEVQTKDLLVPLDKASGSYRDLRRWIRKLSVTLWLWELASLILSAFCMGSILLVVARYNNGPIPDWSCGLTMNGLISFLAVVAKSSLILPLAEGVSQLKWCWFWEHERPVMDYERFDLASRGPWGSLTMLFHPHLWRIGAAGAALTVAALAVEPFLQQIPSYPSRGLASTVASVSRSFHYVDHEEDPTRGDQLLSASLKGAIYEAIFTPGNAQSAMNTPICPTGNCTWPEYSSLGVCSACEDIMPAITFVAQDPYSYWTLPAPFQQSVDVEGMNRLLTSMYMSTAIYNEFNGPFSGGPYSYAFKPVQNHTILDMISVYWPPGDLPKPWKVGADRTPAWDKATRMPPSGVFECILYFCVKSYTGEVQGGQFEETVKSTWPAANESLEHDFSWRPYFNSTLNANLTLRPPALNPPFTVDLLKLDLLRNWAGQTFSYTISSSGGYDSSSVTGVVGAADIAQAFYREQTRTLGPNHTVYNSTIPTTGGAKPLLDQIAASMTRYMRDRDRSSQVIRDDCESTMALGCLSAITLSPVQCVHDLRHCY